MSKIHREAIVWIYILNIHIGCLDAIEETLVSLFPEAFVNVKFKVPKEEVDARREEEQAKWECRMKSIELGEGWFENMR